MRQRFTPVALALVLGLALPAGAVQRRVPGRAGPSAPLSVPNAGAAPRSILPGVTPQDARAESGVKAELGARQEQADAVLGELAQPGGLADGGAKEAAAQLLEGGPRRPGEAAVEVADPAGTAAVPLSASAPQGPSSSKRGPRPPEEPRRDPPPTLGQRWRDFVQYTEVYLTHLHFYLYVNIVNKWPPFYEAWKRLEQPPISRPRAFFAHMRVMGQTGVYKPLGFVARDEKGVLTEARATFKKYFDGPGIGPKEHAAFERFLIRAVSFNSKKRAAPSFRKFVRDSLLTAASIPSGTIADYLDSLYVAKEQHEASDFQGRTAAGILAEFTKVMNEEIAKEPAGAPNRVVGAVLIGSFASGAATPQSDIDGMLLTADGSSARVDAFNKRVLSRWAALGYQKTNPAVIHEHALNPSRRLIRMVIDTKYLILSPDEKLADELGHRGEPSTFTPSRALKPSGYLLRWGQYAAVYLTSLLAK